MKVKSESEVAQSCPTLCDPIDRKAYQGPPPMDFPGKILEWVAVTVSNEFKGTCNSCRVHSALKNALGAESDRLKDKTASATY